MAVGRMQRVPRFVGDTNTVAPASIMNISLGADHRCVWVVVALGGWGQTTGGDAWGGGGGWGVRSWVGLGGGGAPQVGMGVGVVEGPPYR